MANIDATLIKEILESFLFCMYSRVWNKRSPLNKHSPLKFWQKE